VKIASSVPAASPADSPRSTEAAPLTLVQAAPPAPQPAAPAAAGSPAAGTTTTTTTTTNSVTENGGVGVREFPR
jgi:hypothetical protein